MSSPADSLPSSLTADAVSALVPPGQCQFGEDFVEVPLLERHEVTSSTSLLRFGLPDSTKSLGLSTCACLLVGAKVVEGGEQKEDADLVVRPYTPISTNDQIGSFDLLVKNYGDSAHMSPHMDDKLNVGDKLAFKHVGSKNVKIQAPDFVNIPNIAMLVGGTGITPMIQALHAILGDSNTKAKVTMLYGSKSSDDILAKKLLDTWVSKYGGDRRLTVKYVLSHEPEDSDWKGERGMIDKDLITKSDVPGPDGEVMFFVCGPPPMYNALCGPREEQDTVSGILGEMGYSAKQVYKF